MLFRSPSLPNIFCKSFDAPQLPSVTDVMSSILVDASNLYVSTDITYNYITRRGGMGLKNKGGLGIEYRVSIKFQLRLRSGTGPRKTLPENICITGKVIHRPKGFEYVLLQHQIFDGHRLFWHFLSYVKLQINQ